MDLYLSVVLLLFFISLLLYFSRQERPDNFPPGPPGIPVLGALLGPKPYKKALELKKKYGDIIGVRFASHWGVILNNAEDIREAFSKTELSARTGYNFFLDEDVTNANHGVIMSFGKTWQDNRRFTLRTLRDFGFGKRSMENIIMEEVQASIEHLKKMTDKPISTVRIFNLAVFNVTWSIVAGQRYSLDDEQLSKMTEMLIKFLAGVFRGVRLLLLMFPLLVSVKRRLPFLFRNVGDDFRNDLFAFLGKSIDEHRRTREEGNPRDFIDAYLDEQSKIVPAQPQATHDKDDFGFIVLLMDLFIAGSETTSTTLCWSFFLLGLHPECQEKLFQELDSVIGSREVVLEDRSKLPYVEATITEIMRMSAIVPFGVPHSSTEDVKLKGYTIPKGAIVFGNIYASHFDPDHWSEPEKFIPERFLLDDGTVKKDKAVIPFSLGKRSCLGESLARDETFLFLTNLVKNFKISMPSDEPSHSFEGIRGAVNTPEPHRVILTLREA